MSWSRLQNRRKRRIVVFVKADVTRKSRLRHFLHMVENGVNIDAFALDRPAVRKCAHAVDKLYDRSVSSQISRVRARSESSALASSSCAAPQCRIAF